MTYPTTTNIRSNQWAGAITGTASETGGPGVQKTQLTIKSISGASSGKYYDGTGFTSSSPIYLNATGAANWTYNVPVVVSGTYTLTATTSDVSGNAGPTTTLTVTIT